VGYIRELGFDSPLLVTEYKGGQMKNIQKCDWYYEPADLSKMSANELAVRLRALSPLCCWAGFPKDMPKEGEKVKFFRRQWLVIKRHFLLALLEIDNPRFPTDKTPTSEEKEE